MYPHPQNASACLQETFEPEDYVSQDLIDELQQRRPELFKRVKKQKQKKPKQPKQQKQQQQQQQPSADNGSSRNGNSHAADGQPTAASAAAAVDKQAVGAR